MKEEDKGFFLSICQQWAGKEDEESWEINGLNFSWEREGVCVCVGLEEEEWNEITFTVS